MSSRPETRIALLALVILWAALCHHLAVHWNANPQYSFGWLVPVLALYLLRRRWETRPAPAPPSSWAKWLAPVLALAFLPVWLIEQPNPDWRLVSWVLAGEVVALSCCFLALVGGRAWLWHFAFPACFIFTAVPWPAGIEQSVIQGLMRLVAAITVEALNLVNIPALQHGNVIEIGAGLLGVDEACSGVRSLQATLMASLFLGEMSRFDLPRRLLLVVAALFVALLSNVGRTFLLAWSAARDGIDAVGRWHDPAGFTILTVCFVVVWLLALLLGRNRPEPAPAHDVPPAHAPSRGFAIAFATWMVLVLIGTELWFRSNPSAPASTWRLAAPAGARELKIEPAAVEMLQFDRSEAAAWETREGHTWMMYFFEWKPGPSRSRILARMHRPEECLPAGGWQLLAERGPMTLTAGELALPFQTFTFEKKGKRVFVYFCLWQNRAPGAERGRRFATSTQLASLQAVLWRERHLGQQVAELVVLGCKDAEEADAAFRRELPRLLQPAR